MTTLDQQYDHWCDTGPKHSDTYYWELKALQEKCEAFVNSVYDDYSLQTILDYVQKALYDAEIGNLKP